MPLLANGFYAEGDDRGYEAETTYYLGFQIKSALVSLNKLLEEKKDISEFDSFPEYCHFYTDHLLYSMGQINNRFFSSNNKSKKKDRVRRSVNMQNYKFSEKEFPILSNKNARNTVEHLEEYNSSIIEQYGGVGGFNVIFPNMQEDVKEVIERRNDIHPYTLNLIENSLYILRNKEHITIDLMALKEELLKLRRNVDEFKRFLEK